MYTPKRGRNEKRILRWGCYRFTSIFVVLYFCGDFMKIVINSCYGGFSLSSEALLWMYERGAKYLATPVDKYWPPERRVRDADRVTGYEHCLKEWREYLSTPKRTRREPVFLIAFTPDEKFVLSGCRDIERNAALLIECIQELGKKANGSCASLKIVTIPDGTDYVIEEHDGLEHVAEKHETWG